MLSSTGAAAASRLLGAFARVAFLIHGCYCCMTALWKANVQKVLFHENKLYIYIAVGQNDRHSQRMDSLALPAGQVGEASPRTDRPLDNVSLDLHQVTRFVH